MPSEQIEAGGTEPLPPYCIRRGLVADTDVIAQYNIAMAVETEDKHLDPEVIRAGVRRALEDPTRGLYYVAEVAPATASRSGDATTEQAAGFSPRGPETGDNPPSSEMVPRGTSGAATPLIVCQTMITPEWTDWHNGWNWWIQSVYVHPDHRRNGVFSLVYDHIRAAARRDPDVHALRLYVDRDNHVALRCYEQLGMIESRYRIYEEEIGCVPDAPS